MFPNNFEKSRHLATIAVELTLIEPRHAPPPLSQVNMKWAYFFFGFKMKRKANISYATFCRKFIRPIMGLELDRK